MDAARFDTIAKLFAERRLTRRQALARGGAGLASAGAVALGVTAAASGQEATPGPASAQDATPGPTADAEHGPAMLFVQSFQSGSVAPKEGADGRYTVTLEQGLGQTIYFSDRPDRVVGASPTPQFLEGLGFPPDNPPNAALVMETSPGVTDIAVVELFEPRYDPVSRGVTYEVAVLADWEASTELGFTAAPADLAAVAPSFGAAHLFIDDCSTSTIMCVDRQHISRVRGLIRDDAHDGWCYSWANGTCLPCQPWLTDWDEVQNYWNLQCDAAFTECGGNCFAEGVTNG